MKNSKKLLILAIIIICAFGISIKNLYLSSPKTILQSLEISKQPKRMIFQVDYLGFIPFGSIVLENKGIKKIDNQMAYHLHAKAVPYRLINYLYKINAELETFIDIDNLYPIKYIQHIEVNGIEKDNKIVIYDQNKHIMVSEGKRRVILPNTQDHLSATFYLLSQNLSINKPLEFNINTNQKNYRLFCEIESEEKYYLKDKEYSVYTLKGNIRRRDNSPRHATGFTLYLLNNPFRIPLGLKLLSNVGYTTIKLVGVE